MLIEELSKMTARAESAEADARRWQEVATEHKGRADRLQESLAKCEAALKPFTRIPLAYTENIDDDANVFEFEGGCITLGDVRAAYAALTPAGTDETEGRS